MLLKVAIIALFAMLLASLISGLYFLHEDKGTTRRTLHSLGVRITLAGLMMALIGYGIYSGQLTSQAPWDRAMAQPQATQE